MAAQLSDQIVITNQSEVQVWHAPEIWGSARNLMQIVAAPLDHRPGLNGDAENRKAMSHDRIGNCDGVLSPRRSGRPTLGRCGPAFELGRPGEHRQVADLLAKPELDLGRATHDRVTGADPAMEFVP